MTSPGNPPYFLDGTTCNPDPGRVQWSGGDWDWDPNWQPVQLWPFSHWRRDDLPPVTTVKYNLNELFPFFSPVVTGQKGLQLGKPEVAHMDPVQPSIMGFIWFDSEHHQFKIPGFIHPTQLLEYDGHKVSTIWDWKNGKLNFCSRQKKDKPPDKNCVWYIVQEMFGFGKSYNVRPPNDSWFVNTITLATMILITYNLKL